MPCWTEQQVTVNLGAASLEHLEQALKDLKLAPYRAGKTTLYFGNNESFNATTKELRVTAGRDVAEIKRAYSAAVVKSQAKRYGWTLKEVAPFKYEVTKR